jgi:hypothetical protein
MRCGPGGKVRAYFVVCFDVELDFFAGEGADSGGRGLALLFLL